MKRFLFIAVILTALVSSVFAFQSKESKVYPISVADYQRLVQPSEQVYSDKHRDKVAAENAYRAAVAEEELSRRDYLQAFDGLKTVSGVPANEAKDYDPSSRKDDKGNVILEFVKKKT